MGELQDDLLGAQYEHQANTLSRFLAMLVRSSETRPEQIELLLIQALLALSATDILTLRPILASIHL